MNDDGVCKTPKKFRFSVARRRLSLSNNSLSDSDDAVTVNRNDNLSSVDHNEFSMSQNHRKSTITSGESKKMNRKLSSVTIHSNIMPDVQKTKSFQTEESDEKLLSHHSKKLWRKDSSKNRINSRNVTLVVDGTWNSGSKHSTSVKKVSVRNLIGNQEKNEEARRIYNYKCNGILTSGNLSGKQVEWKAVFDKPIEQFIYPSLQLLEQYDNENLANNKKLKLEGFGRFQAGNGSNFRKSNPSAASSNIPTISNEDSENEDTVTSVPLTPTRSIIKQFSFRGNIGNTDPLLSTTTSHADTTQHPLITTPARWKLTLSEPTPPPPSDTNSSCHSIEEPNNANSAKDGTVPLDERLLKGESFLRLNLKSSYLTYIKNSKSIQDDNDDSGDDRILYKISSREARDPFYSSQSKEYREWAGEGIKSSEKLYCDLVKDSTDKTASIALGASANTAASHSDMMQQQEKNSLLDSFGKLGEDHAGITAGIAYYRTKHRASPAVSHNGGTSSRRISKELIIAGSKRSTVLTSHSHSHSHSHSKSTSKAVHLGPRTPTDECEVDVLGETLEVSSPAYLTRIRRATQSRYLGIDYRNYIEEKVKEVKEVEDSKILPRITSSSRGGSRGGSGSSSRPGTSKDQKASSGSSGPSHPYQSSQISRPTSALHPKEDESVKRHAQDTLLIRELETGILPEHLLKKLPHMRLVTTLDLSHFGIGDELGKCLGESLQGLTMLQTLGLRDNRLTSKSIPIIFQNLRSDSLRHIDLSQNNLHGEASAAIGDFFSSENHIICLELSKANIDCTDLSRICGALISRQQVLQELNISNNKIRHRGAVAIGKFLSVSNCPLVWLDLSWNELGIEGGFRLADAISDNTSMRCVDLSANSLKDQGAQRIAASLLVNRSMVELSLAQNGVGEKACFVFSKVLQGNPQMEKLDLSGNPLGDAGARCIFRTILRGLSCFVIMRNCTFDIDERSFNHSNPSVGSPYYLDLSEPYEAALLTELITMVGENAGCGFDSVIYRETKDGKDNNIPLVTKNRAVVLKSTQKRWVPPATGFIRVHFSYQFQIPSLDMAILEDSLKTLLAIVVHAQSDADRKHWMYLLCADAYFLTSQAQRMIDFLVSVNLLGSGGLNKVDLFESVWSNLLDSENKYDFLCANLDFDERHTLAHVMSFEKFRFNWVNPTGHWRLDLSNRGQRNVMNQIAALAAVESEFSEKLSRRGDTSQKGNWFNFRNESYRGAQNEITIDKDFLNSLPWNGVIEFDYVSTSRPSSVKTPTIGPDVFDTLLQKLGLSSRRRLNKSNSIMALMELQLAVIKDYFTTGSVLAILDCFSADDSTQVKVIVCMFSRIKNLESFDIVMRHMSATAVQDLVHRLGWLNVLNPLKPSHDFVLSQRYVDNRITTLKILELAACESGDQLKEHPRSEMNLITLYASIGRIVAEPSNSVFRVTYCEAGERPCPPNWNKRKELLAYFLLGTYPIDNNVYKTIQMYREVEAAGMISIGPIDLQYMEYQNFVRNKASRKSRRGSGASFSSGNAKLGGLGEVLHSDSAGDFNVPISATGSVDSSIGSVFKADDESVEDLSDIVTNDYGSQRINIMSKNA